MSHDGGPPVRIGVIGAGNFASRRHIPDILSCKDASLEGICRRGKEELSLIASHFQIPPEHTYTDWKEMIMHAPLDAVLISTPNSLHYEQAKAALEQGLHVLVEKPMTVHSKDARELTALADEKHLLFAAALNPPHWAHCHQIRRILHDPRVGQLESISLHWSGSVEYAFGRAPAPEIPLGVTPPTFFRSNADMTGGGYFQDGGTHLVSELLWVTGRKVMRVSALMDSLPTDMRTTFSCEMENGLLASIVAVGDSKFPSRRLRHLFTASNGSVAVNNFEFETVIQLQGQETRRFKEADLAPVDGPVANFVGAIKGRNKLYSPASHAADVVTVVEAAYESGRTGRTVTLS